MSGERLNPILKAIEVTEIGTLIGTGVLANLNGELIPTVMAVGTIIGLAAWHGFHNLKNRNSYHIENASLSPADAETLRVIRSSPISKRHKKHDRGPKGQRVHY